ncbi:MAG: hypothetical protein RBR09_12800 [Desulfobulbaceae bacterium]|jgi:hypothetical protein|nr:hypothetical protein [Desulfobulbaceae bacterium]MDY0352128.1 hypothetical protein [Desulfobulbaceae bacterium]
MSRKEEIKLAIKNDLMGHFKLTTGKAGAVLPPDWLYDDFLASLGADEKKILETAVSELIHDGLVEYVGGRRPTYRLTKKGEESLC